MQPLKYRSLSRKMVAEIEHLLIWALQPDGNRAQLRPYRGREMLIESTGDDLWLSRFLYVNPFGPAIVIAQGPSVDEMKQRATPS